MKRTICNPVNISYAYQQSYRSRESADPAVVLFRDEYYLFASHGHGYWVSQNLADWDYIAVDVKKHPQFELFAPAICIVDDVLYITHSQYGTVLKSANPKDPDSWVDIGKAFNWNDPAFWTDDDGYVYVYEGCSDYAPIQVAKLDPKNDMKIVEGPIACAYSDKAKRGFERSGENNEDDERQPYFEGPWMNKIGDKYYLTYAVPGTEFPVYADGCFVGDSPMGPFEYCENSPVCFKNTGFLRGSGHGCLFEDRKGRLWKMDTVSVSVNHSFERRLALFPSKIGEDGRLYTNTEFGDLPMYLPEENDNPFDCPGPELYVLSNNGKAKASSFKAGHEPEKVLEEDARTWWTAAGTEAGEWIEVDFDEKLAAHSLQISLADQDTYDCSGRKNGFGYRYTVEVSSDGENFRVIDEVENEEPNDYSCEYLQFDEITEIKAVRITNHREFPAGGKFTVSGIRIFGKIGDKPHNAPQNVVAKRLADTRSMEISWDPVDNAEGYIIRFGVNPKELNTHMKIYGSCSRAVNCLNAGVPYYIKVDAFNHGGQTETETLLRVD